MTKIKIFIIFLKFKKSVDISVKMIARTILTCFLRFSDIADLMRHNYKKSVVVFLEIIFKNMTFF